jgi:hypothetical protein
VLARGRYCHACLPAKAGSFHRSVLCSSLFQPALQVIIKDFMKILEIRNKLLNDEIDYSYAYEMLKKLPNPWHTKDWSSKRNEIIKSECEQCKTATGIMVAQHLTHPPDFTTIRSKIFNSIFDEATKSTTLLKPKITSKEIKEFHEKTTKIREACPHCKWIRIRKRTTIKPEYHCEKCKVDFDEAITIQYNEVFKTIFPSDEQVINYLLEKMRQEILSNYKKEIYIKNEKEIGKKALLISIEFHLKYIKLENIMTFCKRCAAKMDLDNRLLCFSCKTHYFNYLQYECCFNCSTRNEVIKNPIKQTILQYWLEDNNKLQNYLNNGIE